MEYENFYYGLQNKSTITKQIKELINEDGWNNYYSFKAKPISNSIIDQDPFFRWLRLRYKFRGAILKIDPFTVYNWHTDDRRGVCINMRLNLEAQSISAFETNQKGLLSTFHELKYEQDTYYLFNPQVTHFVVNCDTPRYIFSIEFEKEINKLNYSDLLEDIKFNWENKYNENTLFNRIKIDNFNAIKKQLHSNLAPMIKSNYSVKQFDVLTEDLQQCDLLNDEMNRLRLFKHWLKTTVYVINDNEFNLYSDIKDESYKYSLLLPLNQDCLIKFFDHKNKEIKKCSLYGPSIVNEIVPNYSYFEGPKPLILVKIRLNKTANLNFKK